MVKRVGKNYEMDKAMPKWTGKCPNGQGNAVVPTMSEL